MSLSVHVCGRQVATLDADHLGSRLDYLPGVDRDDFVSLTMPVRQEPWNWPDVLPPIFQMNLPEGYLLQVLQEQFGPHIGASPLNLLSVVGRNMIGRLQVAPPGANLEEPAKPLDVAHLLQGDNSAEAFALLVREHAASGVSGVVPKFLDAGREGGDLGAHKKGTLVTHRHIIKGSSPHLPFITLNEHLCMQVASKVSPTAKTHISHDGQALVVDRFDVDEKGLRHHGMEDFCALLGLRPANKYETTWERITKAVRDHVPARTRSQVNHQLATILLLTYALRNADCHSKNVALLYTGADDVHLAPVYDMLTTSAYANYAKNPPGISLGGTKTWEPRAAMRNQINQVFGVSAHEQKQIVERIGQAVSEVAPQVREAMVMHPGFHEIGKRMLLAWNEGVSSLRNQRLYALGAIDMGAAFSGLSDPDPATPPRQVVGRSDLLKADPLK